MFVRYQANADRIPEASRPEFASFDSERMQRVEQTLDWRWRADGFDATLPVAEGRTGLRVWVHAVVVVGSATLLSQPGLLGTLVGSALVVTSGVALLVAVLLARATLDDVAVSVTDQALRLDDQRIELAQIRDVVYYGRRLRIFTETGAWITSQVPASAPPDAGHLLAAILREAATSAIGDAAVADADSKHARRALAKIRAKAARPTAHSSKI